MSEAHRRYIEKQRGVWLEHFAELDALNAAASRFVIDEELVRQGITHAQVAAMDAVYDKQDQIEREQFEAERAFFREIELILGESQRDHLQRAMDHRTRARCTSHASRIIRESLIDLCVLVDRVVRDPDLLDLADSTLREYERAVTPLTVKLEAELREQDRSIPRLLAWRERDESDQRFPEEERIRRSFESIDLQRAIVARGAELQQEIAELNRATLPKVLEVLPETESSTIRSLYQVIAYPAVYQDRFDEGANLCAQVQVSLELSAEYRAALQVLCESYRQAYLELSADMERCCRAWQEFYAKSRFTLNKYDPYRTEMRSLREKRWALTVKLARQIRAIAPIDVAPHLHQGAEDTERLIEYAIAQSRLPNDNYPGNQ